MFTQLDIVGMGVAGTLVTMMILSLSPTPAPIVVGLVAYGVYVGDRISDTKYDPTATSDRSAFIGRHRRVLSITSAGAYGLAIAIASLGGPRALAITLIPGATWILYAVDLPGGSLAAVKRLKRIFVLNSSLVAAAWAAVMVLLPIVFAGAALTPLAVVLAVYFFIDIFANTEIPNVRDVDDDARNGVSTFPTVVGIRRTRHLLYVVNAVSVLVVAGAYLGGYLPALFAWVLLAGRALAVVLTSRVGRSNNYRRLEFIGEMNYVLVAGGLLIALAV
jgi:4-hydroxybenzoate polyprenyltransferase